MEKDNLEAKVEWKRQKVWWGRRTSPRKPISHKKRVRWYNSEYESEEESEEDRKNWKIRNKVRQRKTTKEENLR